MSSQYYYLISSLPMLRLGETPRLDSAGFLELCRVHAGPARCAQLAAVSLVPGAEPPCCEPYRRWLVWETCLRNQLARARAAGLGLRADEWLRPETDVFPSDARQVDELLAGSDPAARERGLDALRWQRLDDYSVGHTFDFAALVVYRLRLLLAEKWARRAVDRGRDVLGALVDAAVREAQSRRTVAGLQATA